MILLFWSYALIPISHAMAISFSTPLFIYVGGIFTWSSDTVTGGTDFTINKLEEDHRRLSLEKARNREPWELITKNIPQNLALSSITYDPNNKNV